MHTAEHVETLVKLGLTVDQARAFLVLARFGPSGAKRVSQESKIARQDVYRIMLSLEQMGFVEKFIGRPTVYKSILMSQAIRVLVERKNMEQKELQERSHELVRSLESNFSEKKSCESSAQFVIIPGKEVIMERLTKALQGSKDSIEVITSRERFSIAMLQFSSGYASALDRGVRIRIAFERSPVQKPVLEILQNLAKKGGFELRCFSGAPNAIVSIVDGKEASVTIAEMANTMRAAALWSNDSSFVAMAQGYFENRWNNSIAFDRLLDGIEGSERGFKES